MTIEGLPADVLLADLPTFEDHRGRLTEVFRPGRFAVPDSVQWNLVRSTGNVLRGVHAHYHHDDYLTVVDGTVLIGLYDMRPTVPSFGWSGFVELTSDHPQVIDIPKGVAHGFYAAEPTIFLYGLSAEWSPEHDLGCRWDDPALRLDWPCTDPILSERDQAGTTLAELQAAVSAGLGS